MGERYWISGVQIGLLKSEYSKDNEKLKIINEIIENQFIGNKKDLEKLISYRNLTLHNFPDLNPNTKCKDCGKSIKELEG